MTKALTSKFNRLIRTWSMSLHTIRGWFTDIRSWHGPDGIPIRESGSVARIFLLDSASESVGSVVLGGDGDTGDSIGTIIMRSMITVAISRAAERFITEAILITVGDVAKSAGVVSTIQGKRRGLLREIDKQREDMLLPAVRAAFGQAR